MRLKAALLLALALQGSSAWAQVVIDAPAPARSKAGEVVNAMPSAPTPTPAPAPTPAPTSAPATVPGPELTPQVAAWLRQVNALRASGVVCSQSRIAPVPPLRWSAQLERAALQHSQDQARHDFLSHVGSDGSSVDARVLRQGYSATKIGENAAAGQREFEVIGAWLRSPGHCANLMNDSYTEVGIAWAPSRSVYGGYFTMVLANPGQGPAAPTGANLLSREVQAALDAINAVRASGGTCGDKRYPPAPPLVWHEGLAKVLRWSQLKTSGRPAADDPGYTTDRLRAVGYKWDDLFEVAGSGGAAPAPVVLRFLGTASRCDAFLSTRFTHMAVVGAPVVTGSSEMFWNVMLARPER